MTFILKWPRGLGRHRESIAVEVCCERQFRVRAREEVIPPALARRGSEGAPAVVHVEGVHGVAVGHEDVNRAIPIKVTNADRQGHSRVVLGGGSHWSVGEAPLPVTKHQDVLCLDSTDVQIQFRVAWGSVRIALSEVATLSMSWSTSTVTVSSSDLF